uniref:RNase H type-1 domain-containing protein n=1 Tax=Setaria italica TaxID=4555 RepID=K4A1W4_SETIT
MGACLRRAYFMGDKMVATQYNCDLEVVNDPYLNGVRKFHWHQRVSYVENIADAAFAEALVLKEGLLLAQTLGCNRIMIELDCLEVVETMKNDGISATVSAPIFDDCYSMWQEFDSICIDHCNREANGVAHELARIAMQSKLSCNWDDVV